MKLSELQINQKVKLISTKQSKYVENEFIGIVEKQPNIFGEGLWVKSLKNSEGYTVDKKYDNLWNVEIL